MDCFHPIPKPSISDSIAELITKHFGIEDDDEKCNLRLLLDFYADIRTKERLAEAFSRMECEK